MRRSENVIAVMPERVQDVRRNAEQDFGGRAGSAPRCSTASAWPRGGSGMIKHKEPEQHARRHDEVKRPAPADARVGHRPAEHIAERAADRDRHVKPRQDAAAAIDGKEIGNQTGAAGPYAASPTPIKCG